MSAAGRRRGVAAVTLDEAVARALAIARPLEAEAVPLAEALHRTLAEDVLADRDLPARDHSAMDGFAVRAADVAGASAASPVVLRQRGVVTAGGPPLGRPVGAGECARITTGAAIPEGADAVVPLERAAASSPAATSVEILDACGSGANIRLAGEDLRAGAIALARGSRLGPAHVALLAAVGATRPRCGRRARVAVLSTGDEVVAPDRAPGGGVRDANGAGLLAAALACGAQAVSLGIAGDDVEAIAARLATAEAEAADVIVTSAGAGGGERDLVDAALAGLGWRAVFRGVAMKPGRPAALYARERTDVAGERAPTTSSGAALPRVLFALPGNPVAALVAFDVLVRPFLFRLEGRRAAGLPVVTVAAPDLSDEPGRVHLARARLARDPRGGYRVEERLPPGSALLGALCRANALLRLEGRVAAGDPVTALLLEEVLDDA